MRWRSLLPAISVCLLAWILFTTHLDGESMWYDEWYSWATGSQGDVFQIVRHTAETVHPPFYYFWLYSWMRFTDSQSLFMMRLSSVIPAVLAVALCYRAVLDWFKSYHAALAAAAFMATCGIFVYFARELRMYPLMVLLV